MVTLLTVTYTIYSDVGATNNIGSIVVDSNGVVEATHTTGEIYSLVTGTINLLVAIPMQTYTSSVLIQY